MENSKMKNLNVFLMSISMVFLIACSDDDKGSSTIGTDNNAAGTNSPFVGYWLESSYSNSLDIKDAYYDDIDSRDLARVDASGEIYYALRQSGPDAWNTDTIMRYENDGRISYIQNEAFRNEVLENFWSWNVSDEQVQNYVDTQFLEYQRSVENISYRLSGDKIEIKNGANSFYIEVYFRITQEQAEQILNAN